MTTMQMGTKAILMAEPLNRMGHVMKLTRPVHDGLVGEGQRPMTGHAKMMARLSGMEVGSVVGVELMMSGRIWINTKP